MSGVIKGLAKVSGAPIPKIADHEVGKILEKCISSTPAAKIEKIRSRSDGREWGFHKIAYSPNLNFKGRLTKSGKKRYKYANRFPDAVWNAIIEQRKSSLEKKLSLRGLAKQSLLKLAEAAGLTVKAPSYVKKLKANFTKNFSVNRIISEGSYSISLRNSQPTINVIGGNAIVRRAIKGRIKYFQTNMEKGVLDSMEKFAKAYPGIVKISSSGGSTLV